MYKYYWKKTKKYPFVLASFVPYVEIFSSKDKKGKIT